jgi:hypothetical protein
MSFTISGDVLRTLVFSVVCFETMTECTTLFIDNDKLYVNSTDHDDTTVIGIEAPIDHVAGGPCDQRQLSIKCSMIIETLRTMCGVICIVTSASRWVLTDSVGQICIWEHWQPPGIYTRYTGCHNSLVDSVTLSAADLLLYIQQIAICESTVCISLNVLGILRLETVGEFLSIDLKHVPPRSTTTPIVLARDINIIPSSNVIVKYVRSILPLLQRADVVRVSIVNKQCVVIDYDIGPLRAFILLKDQYIV